MIVLMSLQGKMQTMASTSYMSSVAVHTGRRICELPSYTQLYPHSLFLKARGIQRLTQGDESLGDTKKSSTTIECSLTKFSRPALQGPENLDTEPHKYFDQVTITVRAGDGGHGALLKLPKPKVVDKDVRGKRKDKKVAGTYKRGNDGALILPMGGHGGDVYLVADESADTLLPLHRKKRHNAKRGANVDAMGGLSPTLRDGISASKLQIPVPVGTVVKRKRGSKVLADLAKPGDEVLVARGGRGGISVVDVTKNSRSHLRANVATINDPDDKVVTIGAPGEEIALELTLRVVADVGLVGLPNAGKSSLLAAVTLAKPEIADYPFTTLMPNLGCMEGDPLKDDGGFAVGPTMADLPGLIKDAHLGKVLINIKSQGRYSILVALTCVWAQAVLGLGRMFLRHLRRTRLLVHVVDASAPHPVQDYTVLREELHLYNPEYVKRPHIVVLNKLDLPEARVRFEALQERIQSMGVDPEEASGSASSEGPVADEKKTVTWEVRPLAMLDSNDRQEVKSELVSMPALRRQEKETKIEDFRQPVTVVGISARQGEGVENLMKEIRASLQKEQKKPAKGRRDQQREAKPKLFVAPHWQL